MVVAGQGRFNAATPWTAPRCPPDTGSTRIGLPRPRHPADVTQHRFFDFMLHHVTFANSPFVVHHITNGRRTEGEQAARPEETLRYPGDQTRTTTDARRSDAGRLSSTSFMLHYLPTPRERCDGCHFANYPA